MKVPSTENLRNSGTRKNRDKEKSRILGNKIVCEKNPKNSQEFAQEIFNFQNRLFGIYSWFANSDRGYNEFLNFRMKNLDPECF